MDETKNKRKNLTRRDLNDRFLQIWGKKMEKDLASNNYDYRRFNDRKKYNPEIVFSHEDRLYKGRLKNISLGGAFIETRWANEFTKKDIVTISIPHCTDSKNIKRRGSINRKNKEGFAIEFI